MPEAARGDEPMLARLIESFPPPSDHGWLYEPKWDGFRCIASRSTGGGVQLRSRRGKSMNQPFPDIAAVVDKYVPAGTVIDGEIVRWTPEGRLDFTALQDRNRAGPNAGKLARTSPAHYVVFDLLRLRGENLRLQPLSERRAQLEQLFADAGVPATSSLTLGLQTDDQDLAVDWHEKLGVVGIEGVMIKDAAGTYRPGARDWLKLKKYRTAEAILGGVTGSLERPRSLILGRYTSAGSGLTVVARTVEIRDNQTAAALGRLLTPAGDEHPWPTELPPSWTSVIYGAKRGPTQYVRVQPELVVEIRVDTAIGDQRWRHGARYLRARTDLDPANVPRDLELEPDLDTGRSS